MKTVASVKNPNGRTKRKATNIILPQQTFDHLTRLASATLRSKSSIVTSALAGLTVEELAARDVRTGRAVPME